MKPFSDVSQQLKISGVDWRIAIVHPDCGLVVRVKPAFGSRRANLQGHANICRLALKEIRGAFAAHFFGSRGYEHQIARELLLHNLAKRQDPGGKIRAVIQEGGGNVVTDLDEIPSLPPERHPCAG